MNVQNNKTLSEFKEVVGNPQFLIKTGFNYKKVRIYNDEEDGQKIRVKNKLELLI